MSLNIKILQADVAYTAAAHNKALAVLAEFISRPENNIFDTLEEATDSIEDELFCIADKACEGSHCCGLDQYTQEFIVGNQHYRGVLDVEYNRHDKTYYYYVNNSKFSYTLI